mmetsp:Transcript_3749/g.4848  ORF Transcript_3749/g.4848 Transcript_3749/m.4848 type:complete len:367 (-) Transcript_3749:60-1160(-)
MLSSFSLLLLLVFFLCVIASGGPPNGQKEWKQQVKEQEQQHKKQSNKQGPKFFLKENFEDLERPVFWGAEREEERNKISEREEIPSLEIGDDDLDFLDPESIGDECEACSPGHFHNLNESDTSDPCLPCASGHCQKGECPPCPAGTATPEFGSRICPPCTKNTVAPEGSLFCEPCTEGHQPDAQNATCESCPAGYYNNQTAFGSCESCPKGSQSLNTTSCTLCPVGTSNPFAGSPDGCLPCHPGFYLSYQGAENPNDCQVCPSGYFCPSDTTGTPTICPSNTYCKAGSIEPKDCGFFGRSQPGSSSCNPDAFFYILITFIVLTCLGIAGFIILVIRKPNMFFKRLGNEEEENMIPQSLPGPVYGGY